MASPRIQPRPLAVKLNNTIRMPPRAADCPECEECDESGAMSVGIFWADGLTTIFGTGQPDFDEAEDNEVHYSAMLKTLDDEPYTGPWPNLSEWQWNIRTDLYGIEEGGVVLTGAPNGYEFDFVAYDGGWSGQVVATFTIYAETIGGARLSPNFTLIFTYTDPDS